MAWYHPLLFALDAERAHRLTVRLLALSPPLGRPVTATRLRTQVAGLDFPNPVGLAAGVDKDGEAVPGWFGLGFGSVEVGTLTPLAQPGNPRPRLFRLREDRGVINRFGFNNGGLPAALARLPTTRRGVLGINVGANKDAADWIADYRAGVAGAAPHADYVTINVSSPNTPGLRDLQHGAALAELLAATRAAAGTTPLFLKVAPDLTAPQIEGIVRAATAHRLDALIVGNTTVTRPPDLNAPLAREPGGLSGAPLMSLAHEALVSFRRSTGGTIPLIAAGGIGGPHEAYGRIRAGASLVQLYTALIYQGPGLARRIAQGLDALLARDGFANVADAVGVDA